MFYNGTKGVVTKVTDFKSPVRPSNSNIKHPGVASSFSGGIISDLDLAWTFSGPTLKVFNTAEGTIQSSWDFSSVTRDTRTQIKCVIEYPVCDNSRLPTKENQICLVVGYTSKKDSSKSSYISFCHPRTSRILHTITTKEKITCMSLIAAKKDHTNPLSGVLKTMSGALAIGTQSGNLLVLDIKDIFNYCRRNTLDSLRNRFSEMVILDLKRMSENDIKDRISKVDGQSNHYAVLLSDKKDSRDPDVEICALTYIQESTCLAVGTKNGSFQLWDVNTLKKLYKSPTLEGHTPVVGFGFQEPCNDPQNFCYLWVLYESESKNESCLPFAVMYGILYKKVTNISTYGRHYRNFVHCKKRFDLDVDLERCVNGKCIASSVVSNTPSNILRHAGANEEDASKINLFVMVFETWEHNADVNSSISIIVFDMNQWYKAQMPHQCYVGYAVPFINFMLLEHVSERKGTILDMRIKKDTIQQFLSFNLSEEYSYPSSLSFDTIFLADSKIINVRIPGAQRSVLERIISEGPIGLVNPSKYYTECKEAALRPCFLDSFNHTIVPTQIQQRNYILTILLENKISSFLVRCVKDWADGSRGVSGCTLPNLIQWAWDCISRIKLTTDVICIPLFDYSGDDLDRENYQKLKHCVQLIHIIRDLLVYIYKNFKQFLLDDIKLKHQVDTLQLVTKYFDAIIWCLDCGLLPEKVSGSTEKCVPIYIVNILQYTEQRREELKEMGLNDKYFLIENAPPLIVDAVLEQDPKGKKLQIQWQRESGGMTTGLYPPITLQSLLRIFLLPDLSTDIKHFITLYFLFDVCDYHRDEEMKEQLLSFSVIFSLDIAFFSLVQACWLLDHEKFEEAVDILTADAVINQLRLQPLLYKTIMQACVCQKQYGVALKLERLVKLSGVVFPDERFYVTLLLQNGLVMEAYTTLKKVSFGQKELLRHFFRVCDDFGLLKEIFKFPISAAEENEFMSYLDESSSRDAGDLKIMYLLSRGRYVEAVDVNHNLASVVPKFEVVGRETAKQNSKVGRVTTRDLLVGAFSKTLPGVTNELISFCRKEKDKIYRYKEVDKPTPLSVVVHTDTSQQIPTYKSSFETVLQAAISKTAETWSSFPKLSKRKNYNASVVKDTPFLRSDIMTPKKDSSLFFSREKANSAEKKADVEEPPAKRRKTILNQTLDFASETNASELLMSPSVEVTKILTTPHVQKRLNKLLQNTPESSPLQSILKSSEISRFRQPQKVGFNFPVSSPTSHKVAVIAETPTVSLKSTLKRSSTFSAVKKIIDDDFISSPQKRVDVIVENVAVTQQGKVPSPVSESLDTSTNADSYYSLESENELKDFKTNETPAKHSAMVQTNVSHHTFIESMSEDETAETSNRIIMEVMSEEESAAENQSRQIVVDIHTEPTLPVPSAEVKETYDSQQTFKTSGITANTTVTEQSEAAVLEQHIPSSFVGEPEINEISSPTPQFPIQISSTFSVSSDCHADRDQFGSDENVSFATMQPVAAESVYENQESNTKTQPSWESIYEEYRAANTYSSQLNENDTEMKGSRDHKDEKNADVIGSLSESYPAEYNVESAADENFERSFQPQPNSNSVTEIPDSSGEDDSDIEILEDESTVAPPRRADENFDDLSAEENDDISENSYESEYTYSQESGEAESNADDNSVADVQEAEDESDDNVGRETQEIDQESEDECEEEVTDDDGENDDVEEEYEEDEEEDVEEEPEVSRQPVDEENVIAIDESEVPVAVSFDAETLCRENPSINYEELKEIVSNVAAVEAKTEIVASPEVRAKKTYDSVIASPSQNHSVNEFSFCEVYDATQSVVEETVNLDFSDSVVQPSDISIVDTSVSANVTFAEKSTEAVDKSEKLDSTFEVVSLSTLRKEESSEPPMIFYFGENSVTSIGEEILIDEVENSKSTFAGDQNSQLAGEVTQSELSKADNSIQVADDSAVAMEIEEAYTSQNCTQSESIYVIDIDSEISLEEGMAKNRSFINQSLNTVSHDISELKNEDRKTSPLSGSTPVSKGLRIRSTAAVHMPEDTFSTAESEYVPMSGISAQATPATIAPSADTESRISVITETMSPKTSPKAESSSNITSSPFVFVEKNSSEVSDSLVAVRPLSPCKQLISAEEQKRSIDKSSVDRDCPLASPFQPSPNKSVSEASHISQVQLSSSPHFISHANVKLSPSEKLVEKTTGNQDSNASRLVSSSIAPSSSHLILATDDSNQSLAVDRSSLSFGSPFAGFESPPDKSIAGRSRLSIFKELLGSCATDPAADLKSSSVGHQSVCVSEPSLPGSTTTLITSQSSVTKLNVGEVCHEVQYNPCNTSGPSALSPKHTSEESGHSSKIPERRSYLNDSPLSTFIEPISSEKNMDEDSFKEQSSVNSLSTVTIFDESSFDQSRTVSRIAKPIVAYTPSPTRISFSETVCLTPSPESNKSVPQSSHSALKCEESEELICISSSTSPGTNSEKKSALVSPNSRTATISPQSISTDMGQVSPASGHNLRTPEKIRSSQSSVLALSTPPQNSVASSPQVAHSSSSPETFDATYNSHVGVKRLRKDSAVSSRISSPSSSSKTSDITVTEPQDDPNSDVEDDHESASLIAPSPRRSMRLARRVSTDSILDAVLEEESESGTSPARPRSRKSTRRTPDRLIGAGVTPVFNPAADESDNDDAVSVKSAASAAESVSSRASTVSNRSQTRKRSSFTRLEMRKSSVRPSFRPLQVILSDEEMTSPTKSEIGFDRQREVVERKYASSEPGDLSSGSRQSKRSRTSCVASDEDDRLNTSSERQSKKMRKRNTKRQSDKNLLNAAMLASPAPQKSHLKRLVSSTPMKEQKAPSTAAVSDYTMSRRLTRFQRTLLEGGIRRGEQSDSYDEERLRASVAALEDVPEETELADLEKELPAGSLRLTVREPNEEEDDDEAELTTRAVRNRTIKTRASDIRASRGKTSKKAMAATPSSSSPARHEPPSADVSSDESVSSRASTSSRRKGRTSTFTKMELRRSSARPQFKPLSVIPSDEESNSFQTPPRPTHSAHEDEGLPSSSESTHSKRSSARRSLTSTSATTVATRSRRIGSDHSDHDTSSVSDISTVSTATRRSRRSVAAEVAIPASQPKEVSEKSTPIKKRAAKIQTVVEEPPIKEIPKKRKRT